MQRFSVQHEPSKDPEGDYGLIAEFSAEEQKWKNDSDESRKFMDEQEEQINTLTESIAFWKRQWRLMESANKKAEEEIKRLGEENDWLHRKMKRTVDAALKSEEEVEK